MNLRLFFAKPKNRFFYLLCVILWLPSCARKNRRVYDFSTPQQPSVLRVTLPYVAHLNGVYDKKLERCDLNWPAVSMLGAPVGVRFVGYNIYRGTKLGFSPRLAHMQVPPGTHTCVIEGALTAGDQQFFAIVPMFVDAVNREILGLHTVTTVHGY